MVEKNDQERAREAARLAILALGATGWSSAVEGVMSVTRDGLVVVEKDLKVADRFDIRASLEGGACVRARAPTVGYTYRLSPTEVRELIQLLEPHAEKVR